MYDYQSQTSLPPIRARQPRPNGVQVQQLYESSPVLAAITHHPSSNQYSSVKPSHDESSTIINGNSTAVGNNTSGTTNGYSNSSHPQHNSTLQGGGQAQTSEQSLRKSPSVDSMLSLHSSSQPRRTNALDPDAAMKTYMSKLTAYERHEIFSYPQIYFVGQNARKRQGVGGGPNNGKEERLQSKVETVAFLICRRCVVYHERQILARAIDLGFRSCS